MAEPITPRESANEQAEQLEAQTEKAPTETAQTETAQTTVVIEVPEAPPPPKRRRWVWWVAALAVLGILLVVGWFVADSWARAQALATVRERVVALLDLPPDAHVDVEIASGSVLLQAMRGALDEVRVGVDEFTVGELSGSAQLVATRVPLDSSQPVGSLDIEVRIDESQVQTLASYFSGLELEQIELRDEMIKVSTTWRVLFLEVPLALDLAPSATGPGISFDPKIVYVGSERFTVADLRANPQLSQIAGSLLAAQDFCVADRIPAPLSVTDARIVGNELVITIGAAEIAFDDPAFARNGTC